MGEVRVPLWAAAYETSEEVLHQVLAKLRLPMQTAVLDAIFDDLEEVLGPYTLPNSDDVPALARRMRSHLAQLIDLLPQYEPHPEMITDLISAATTLLAVDVPDGDYMGVRVHLRRTAQACLAVLDHIQPVPVPTP